MDATKAKVYKGYLEHLLIKGLAKSTTDLYAKEAKSFIEFVDDLEAINNSIVFNYLSKYSNLSNSSKNQHGSFVRAFMGYLTKNVYPHMSKITIPYIRDNRRLPDILDQAEFIRRLNVVKRTSDMSDNWIEKRNFAFIMLLYSTGMRVSEALDFKRYNIGEDGWVRIDSGKGLKDRMVPIAKEAVVALDMYVKVCPLPLKNRFFLNKKGEPLSRVEAYKILKKCMGMSPHSIRHHFATHMIINGADVNVVSEFLGHSSLITTQIYTHIKKPKLLTTVSTCHPFAKESAHAV